MLHIRAMLIETGDSARREVRTALEAVLASPLFAGKRRGELLRYLAERTLAGKGGSNSRRVGMCQRSSAKKLPCRHPKAGVGRSG